VSRPRPIDVLHMLGGTASTSAIVALCGRRALATGVSGGHVVRARRGVYVLAELATPTVLAARTGGVVSHASAAIAYGLDVVVAPTVPHITVRHSARRVQGVHVHWADLGPDEVDGVLTSPLRTVVDCARTLPFGEALAIADGAVRRRLVTTGSLEQTAVSTTGPCRRRVLRVAAATDGRSASALESVLRAVLIEERISGFVPQQVIGDEAFTARVDFAHRTRPVIIEADSFAPPITATGPRWFRTASATTSW